MESFQPDVENLIVALQSNRSLKVIYISGGVLAAIGERDQGRLFCSLGNLPTLQGMSVWGGTGSPMAIHTRVLTDALSETSNGLKSLVLLGLKISSRLEVEQLARGLKARAGSLISLTLGDILLDVEDKRGFLDSILLALTPVPGEPSGKLSRFALSCVKDASNEASVVSPEALGAFFAEEPIEILSGRTFHLNNVGLNDSHCEAMAQEPGRDASLSSQIDVLDLSSNTSIRQQGYEALLGLLNRRFDIGVLEVDDQKWKSTFDMVVHMNLQHQRRRFLEKGVFSSKEMWVNFLAGLSTGRYWSEEDDDEEDDEEDEDNDIEDDDDEEDEAKRLNAIWYTLTEDPDFIYT
jgi:hypothetical protein